MEAGSPFLPTRDMGLFEQVKDLQGRTYTLRSMIQPQKMPRHDLFILLK
jgi:hypothetical protein